MSNPLEAAIRAACQYMGANPDSWEGFRGVGKVAADAFLAALPMHPEERDEWRLYIDSLNP